MPFDRRLRSLPIANVRLTDRFWTGYQRRLLESTLPAQFEQLVETKRLANFVRAAAKEEGGFEGLIFNDSDVYKYIEACAYALAVAPDLVGASAIDRVRRQMDEAIEIVAAAQMPDGYLDTYFQLMHPTMRWRNLHTMHEMYCAGHLIEAGVAVYECLGEDRLLKVARRFADHVMSVFGPGKRRGYGGHEEIELALLRLAEATGESKYREFARWLVEERGKPNSPFATEVFDKEALAVAPWGPGMLLRDGRYNGEYAQDHLPIREHSAVVGHAVRAMYLYIAAAQLAPDADDPELDAALERTWASLTRRRMYVTGGIGPSARNEGFTADYDLPNLSAYAETCAAVGLVFWGRRLLEATANSEYADVIERALFNGCLSGISLDGTHYFYDNPLESRGEHRRVPWFGCACCPPNIARLIGSVAQYLVSQEGNSFYIHIPAGLRAETSFGETDATLTIEGDYPWEGRFTVRVDAARPVPFRLCIRIPDWADEMETDLPEATEEADYESGYAVFDREWQPGEVLTVDLGMRPRWVEADPRVRDDLGRVALSYGPLVYCMEEKDLGYAPQLFAADVSAEATLARNGDRMEIDVEGVREVESESDELYAEFGTTPVEEATARFIPYHAWANRGANHMVVWSRRV